MTAVIALLLPEIPDQVLEYVTLVEAIGGLILTALLFILYYRISETQKTQTEIQKTQSKIMQKQSSIMAAEYRPDIQSEELDVQEDDVFYFRLSNTGNGKAKDLGLVTYVYYKHHKENDGPIYVPTFGTRMADWGFHILQDLKPLRRYESGSSINDETERQLLKPGEIDVPFLGEAGLILSPMFNDNKIPKPFTQIVNRIIEEWEIETLGFEICAVYRNDAEEWGYSRLHTLIDIKIKKDMKLIEAVRDGKEVEEPMSAYLTDGKNPGIPLMHSEIPDRYRESV
jgi:hypothetical protein